MAEPALDGAASGCEVMLFLVVRAISDRENFKNLLSITELRRKLRMYVRLMLNLGDQLKIARMLKDDVLSNIPNLQSAFPFKFVHESLLCQGLSTKDRARCLLVNYRFWQSRLNPYSLLQIVTGNSVVLFERKRDDCHVAITFCLSMPIYVEGEMSLLLTVDNVIAYTLSFTIVPGDLVGASTECAVLISRLQGVKDGGWLSRRAAVVLGVQPQKALLDALQGLSLSMGISYLSGIRAEYQSCYMLEYDTLFRKTYDQFYEANGMAAIDERHFAGEVPLSMKPIRSPSRHRTHLRQARRKEIFESVRRFVGRSVAVAHDRWAAILTDDTPPDHLPVTETPHMAEAPSATLSG